MEGPRASEGVDFRALAASVRTCSPNVRQRAANDGRDRWYHRALTRFAPSGKRDVVDNAGAGRVVPYTHYRRACTSTTSFRVRRAAATRRRTSRSCVRRATWRKVTPVPNGTASRPPRSVTGGGRGAERRSRAVAGLSWATQRTWIVARGTRERRRARKCDRRGRSNVHWVWRPWWPSSDAKAPAHFGNSRKR
jgi:hypothetical protein